MKKLLYFAIGAVIGSTATYFAVKGYFQKLANEEINDVKEAYQKRAVSKDLAEKNSEMKKELLKEVIDIQREPENIMTEETKNTSVEDVNKYMELRTPYASKNHNIFRNPVNAEEIDNGYEDEEEPEDFVIDHTESNNRYSDPYEISEEEFASEKLFYDKVIINFYLDGIGVLDDTDELVDSMEELIGPDILKELNNSNKIDELDSIFIRNDDRSTDYGLMFIHKNFVREDTVN